MKHAVPDPEDVVPERPNARINPISKVVVGTALTTEGVQHAYAWQYTCPVCGAKDHVRLSANGKPALRVARAIRKGKTPPLSIDSISHGTCTTRKQAKDKLTYHMNLKHKSHKAILVGGRSR